MSAPTREDLKQRIRDYMATYTNIGTDVTDADVGMMAFPAYEVEIFGTTRRRSGKRNVSTYTVRVYIYGCIARDVTDDAKWRADRAAAEAFIDPIADFIADNPTLKLATGSPVNLVANDSDMVVNDQGVGQININKKAYAGFALEFQVTIGR